MAKILDWRRFIPLGEAIPHCTPSVAARQGDLEMFAVRARRGEIPWRAVVPLAIVWAACRKAQTMIGSGHLPLETVLDAFPEQYVQNCLMRRATRLANQAGQDRRAA